MYSEEGVLFLLITIEIEEQLQAIGFSLSKNSRDFYSNVNILNEIIENLVIISNIYFCNCKL
jgi:hypothetical protein